VTKPTASRDSMARRSRSQAQSTGKKVKPTERDLIWFAKLHEHGPLSSSFLDAFTKDRWPNEKKAKERLTDLFNEGNTPHNGTYLTRPKQQFNTMDARHHELIHDLSKASEKALREKQLWKEERPSLSSPWRHQYMVACITASIEIATLAHNDITYIPASAILGRAKTNLRHPVSVLWPDAIKPIESDLVPDGLFGLEYGAGEEKLYRFFVLEADRGTQVAKTKNYNRKSFIRHVLQYREYVGAGDYREHLNLTAPLCVLNVSNSTVREERLMTVLKELTGPEGSNYQLFQTYDGFGEVFKPPVLDTSFLNNGWKRVGGSAIKIDCVEMGNGGVG